MKYLIITHTKARSFVQSRLLGEELREADFVMEKEVVDSGSNLEIKVLLDELNIDLHKIQHFKQGDFDAKARPLVFAALDRLPHDVKRDLDFWRYLSSVRFFEITKWRHPKTAKSSVSESENENAVDSNLKNYGAFGLQVTESLFFRLYKGAELAYDIGNKQNPFHLCEISNVDLWQSHIIRLTAGCNQSYVRSLLEWVKLRDSWYEKHLSKKHQKLKVIDSETDKNDHLRDLVKRIRRHRSNVVHEFLSHQELEAIINFEAEKSLGDGLSIPKWKEKKEEKRKKKSNPGS